MRGVSRRTALGLGAAMALAGPARAEALADFETVRLWPGNAAPTFKIEEMSSDPTIHARWITAITAPFLLVFRPERPDGSALLTIPGGGYGFLSVDNEGIEVGKRLARSGVTVFVLLHRLPHEGWTNGADVPLADAQRALRLIRTTPGIDPARVGVIGFSAGGHVAASLATRSTARVYEPVDATDVVDATPAFAALLYPVITMGEGAHEGSRANLLGAQPSREAIIVHSLERQVTPATPPTFLCLAAGDDIVPVGPNGLAMANALLAAKVPVELHLFEDGKHGFGARAVKGTTPSLWPELLLHWGWRKGWFRDSSAAPA